jgi:hypothetical protein
LNSFGLGVPGFFAAGWREIVRFVLYIKQLVAFEVER